MQNKKGSGTMILDEMGHGKRDSKKNYFSKYVLNVLPEKKIAQTNQ